LIAPSIGGHIQRMRCNTLTIVMMAIIALLTSPSAAQVRNDPVTAGTPIIAGTRHILSSATLGDTREVNVWLPTGYAESTDRYPVVYVIDGALDQDFGHIAGLGQLASVSWTFGPMIIVGVQTRNRSIELTPPPTDPRYVRTWPQSGGADRFRRFLSSEVIPFIEERYRTTERRALMGESLGGLFVTNTLLTQPELFNDYVAISPSLWWDDRRGLRHLRTGTTRPQLRGKRLFLAIADEGGTMQDGVNLLRDYLSALPSGSVEVSYADYSASATHATIYHRAAEMALRWLYPAPPYPRGPMPWYMIEGAEPPSPSP
jgi:hypothetical protein